MADVKTTFNKVELKILRIAMELMRANMNGEIVKVQEENVKNSEDRVNKLYYKVVGLSDKASRTK